MLSRDYCGRIIVAVTIVTLSLLLSDDAFRQWGIYDRAAFESGQWWRALSAHFTHLNFPHLILNLGAWILIWIYGWPVCNTRTWLWLIITTSVLTGLTLHFFEPQIPWHGGLSGLLHGLFLSVAMLKLRTDISDWNAWVALAAVVGKLVWEWYNGAMPGTQELIGGRVLTEGHLHGSINAFCVTLLLFLWQRQARTQSTLPEHH